MSEHLTPSQEANAIAAKYSNLLGDRAMELQTDIAAAIRAARPGSSTSLLVSRLREFTGYASVRCQYSANGVTSLVSVLEAAADALSSQEATGAPLSGHRDGRCTDSLCYCKNSLRGDG